jgi:hypothetical protein
MLVQKCVQVYLGIKYEKTQLKSKETHFQRIKSKHEDPRAHKQN